MLSRKETMKFRTTEQQSEEKRAKAAKAEAEACEMIMDRLSKRKISEPLVDAGVLAKTFVLTCNSWINRLLKEKKSTCTAKRDEVAAPRSYSAG